MQMKIQLVVRLLLGALFLFSGIAYFAMPTPDIPPGDLSTFMTGMMASKYFFTLLKCTEIFCGALLVSGFFVPLALVILAPISINIFFVHLFLVGPSTLALPLAIGAALIYLSFFSPSYSPTIKKLFVKKP
jgi:putative oxidoreductase